MTELIVYTTSAFTCPFCVRVMTALLQNGYCYIEKDVARPEVKAELMEKRPSARTVPQVFLPDGTYIGDCDETLAMIGNGKLDLLISMCEPAKPLNDPILSDHELRVIIAQIWKGLPQEQRMVGPTIANLTDDLYQFLLCFEDDNIPAEVVLAMLVRVTRIYADKLNIPLDNIMKALATAGNTEGEVKTCTI